jgi:hypothetical protein
MRRFLTLLLATLTVAGLSAQNPQPRLTYEERGGTAGQNLVIDGKTFGPYKEVTLAERSASGTAGLFFATKRDKTYVVAQGREWGPLTAGFNTDSSYISDDGKVWAVSTVQDVESDSSSDSDDTATSKTVLWVNGRSYGPYLSLSDFQYAETGGSWMAQVQVSDSESAILLNGKTVGSFSSVDHIWMFPDGSDWGYVVSNDDGTNVVTSTKSYKAVQNSDFSSMDPKKAHWAYSIRTGDEEELIVVDGKAYSGYINFNGLNLSASTRHWGFEAEKLSDDGDHPVIVVDGKEYLGEGLLVSSLGDKEFFMWSVKDGTKVTTQVLPLP